MPSWWIPSYQTLGDHPKMLKAARALGIDPVQMAGHLHYLWWWCMDYAPDGDLTHYSRDDIAAGARWPGNAEQFVEALVNCRLGDHPGFLDRTGSRLTLHDWHDYAGEIVTARQQDAQRKRLARQCRREAGDAARQVGKVHRT